ncbi:MAG: hypothetical protein Q7R33_06025, partial [Nitrosarchaeum sp.]|nr:hypothetical protein [Nitrosarchaeum sp.]
KPKIKIASSIAEKEARKLLMTGVSLEKMSSIIKRQYNTNRDVSKFENEFGKLGYIYIDASLVDTCDDLSTILKSSNRVANVGIKFVKTTTKCASCIYNKRSECIKLGLTIADKPEIKTAAEAKNILNKFAALKYVNSFFVKAADLTTYYTRLANEDPQKVVTEFLTDVDNRRKASTEIDVSPKQKIEMRIAAVNTNNKHENHDSRPAVTGRADTEVATAFKQSLLKTASVKSAKAELTKCFGSNRVAAYIDEASDDIKKFARFIQSKNIGTIRLASTEVDLTKVNSPSMRLSKQTDDDRINGAVRMAYSLKTLRHSHKDINRRIASVFGKDISTQIADKLATDKTAQLIGLAYIDANLYNSVNEMKDIYSVINRAAKNTVCLIKEGKVCKLAENPNGICKTTGLKIVSSINVETKDQAMDVLANTQKLGYANDAEVAKIASMLRDGDATSNVQVLKAFLLDVKNRKANISSSLVKQITNVALKYAKDVTEIRKLATKTWHSAKSLISVLDQHIVNKQAFADDVNSAITKTASEANVYLNGTNQYATEIFDAPKDSLDIMLARTM